LTVLCLEHVSKRFDRPGRPRVALDDVSLSVDRGEIVGVFGPSGAGKTTLLRIAAGLARPDGGAVSYGGERFDRMSASERTRLRRREIACVWTPGAWQERLGVVDHVALPLLIDGCGRRTAERRVHEALLACEAEQCAGMELGELSDGERQRVAIARALVTEPRLLVADGPTSSLSPVEQEEVMVLLATLAHEARVAVLIAASDAQALVRADPILYLRDGRLIDAEPDGERGKVYRLPTLSSRRASSDA
jgi:putative ABC transport system ATP-binding protein